MSKDKARLLFSLAGAAALGTRLLSVLWAGPAPQEEQEIRHYQFKKVKGISVAVLRKEAFQELFETNLEIPKTNQAVIQLARQIYSRAFRAQVSEECGEHLYGSLFAALSNPDISDETRDAVDIAIDADTPALPQTYINGHFKFLYTTNDSNADNNVTLQDIQATATVLNNAWKDYATDFKIPKSYFSWPHGFMVDVKVYYLGPTLYGSTASQQNYIELNSKLVVRDACKRQTTPVHELFHRVQYAYGYVTGTAGMRWATEGTASWSQKYCASNVGDWMDRVSQGLQNPDQALLGRSYDACFFWIYLGQRGNGERESVRLAWQTYQTNGFKMKDAVETVIKQRISPAYGLDGLVGWWTFANYHKDLANAVPYFDYEEDEWTRKCDSVTKGPLASVVPTVQALNLGTNWTTSGSVSAHGADYFVFNIGSTVKKVEVKATAATNTFGYAIMEVTNDNYVGYNQLFAGGALNYTYSKTVTPGQLKQLVLVVTGNPTGGNYSINAKGSL